MEIPEQPEEKEEVQPPMKIEESKPQEPKLIS
jgi:hypothetical protein